MAESVVVVVGGFFTLLTVTVMLVSELTALLMVTVKVFPSMEQVPLLEEHAAEARVISVGKSNLTNDV